MTLELSNNTTKLPSEGLCSWPPMGLRAPFEKSCLSSYPW